MTDILLAILIFLVLCLIALVCVLLRRQSRARDFSELIDDIERIRREIADSQRENRVELSDTTQRSVKAMGTLMMEAVQGSGTQLEKRFSSFSVENEQKLENIRLTVERRLSAIQQDNAKKLDEMRGIVDDKLQKTLDSRMTESFKLVNDRLEQVYKGLGEMQALAVGVGDLKKVLSNVKTRGTLGEIQLGAILEEILAPEQYAVNVCTVPGSKNPVEFAVKLPADGGEHILLPIDSKFPTDAYTLLMEAYDSGSPERVKAASEALRARIRGFAKDIRDKYISPPDTTEFAIMFLPTEGLYAEAVKLSLIEQLQREFRVNIAGPSTMAALLNSLQMGFRSVAIQKRSGEVWKVLSAVKTEFDKFQKVLARTQERLTSANNELDQLVGVRTRQIRSKLSGVAAMPLGEVKLYLPDGEGDAPFDDDGEDAEK